MNYSLIDEHRFLLEPQSSGGESVVLITMYFRYNNGDIFTNHKVVLNSYSNSANILLTSPLFTPQRLREWADELESKMISVKIAHGK